MHGHQQRLRLSADAIQGLLISQVAGSIIKQWLEPSPGDFALYGVPTSRIPPSFYGILAKVVPIPSGQKG